MKSRFIVCAIIEKDGMLLFGEKPKDIGPYPNTLHLLGGGVKLESESLKEALEREIKEEAGIEIKILDRVDFDEDYEKDKNGELTHYIFLTFLAKYISGYPKPKDDISNLVWVSKERLSEANLNRASIKLFKKIGYL